MSELPRLLTLDEAAKRLNPKLTAKALRTMARRGMLRLVEIAGKHFVTEESVTSMVAAATKPPEPSCRVVDCLPASTCAEGVPARASAPGGSLSTDRVRLAQASASMSVNALKKRSRPTSPNATGHQLAPTNQGSFSSRK
jgi:hypothetical protein